MQNESDNILDNLTFTNGKEKVEEVDAPKKKVAKKTAKKESKYSKEYLNSLSSPKLRALCVKLGIKVNGDRADMIADILKK